MCLFALLMVSTPDLGTPAVDVTLIAQLIEQLGSPVYVEREAASRALDRLGEPALESLQRVSEEYEDAEIVRRAKRLVTNIEPRVIEARALAIRRSQLSPEEKGRKLKEMVKEGMTNKEVYRLLGLPSGLAGTNHRSVAFYDAYGFTIEFDQNHKVELVEKIRPKR
jgi:hypothetical protein